MNQMQPNKQKLTHQPTSPTLQETITGVNMPKKIKPVIADRNFTGTISNHASLDKVMTRYSYDNNGGNYQGL
jgi:hypothetical protein